MHHLLVQCLLLGGQLAAQEAAVRIGEGERALAAADGRGHGGGKVEGERLDKHPQRALLVRARLGRAAPRVVGEEVLERPLAEDVRQPLLAEQAGLRRHPKMSRGAPRCAEVRRGAPR